MLRSVLIALAVVTLPLWNRADYTVCTKIDNGPIVDQRSPTPFARQPDFAAMTAYPRTEFFDGMPPERFRAPRTMTVETESVDKCGEAASGHFFEACVRGTTVYMPNPCDFPDERFARLLCHETGHLNGWPADHGS